MERWETFAETLAELLLLPSLLLWSPLLLVPCVAMAHTLKIRLILGFLVNYNDDTQTEKTETKRERESERNP